MNLILPPVLLVFVPPYLDHDASCVMLNVDWTPRRIRFFLLHPTRVVCMHTDHTRVS